MTAISRTTARPLAVVVTGASAGVGRALVLRLARQGARIGLIARDAAALESLAEKIRSRGGEALALPCDVADADAVFRAADRAAAAFGGIDVWVNDAMATVFGAVGTTSADEIRRVTEVTYLGCVHGTMAALRHMRPRGHGVIVQVGSALAYRGIPLQAAYCGAKHAIRGFTDSLRAELIAQDSPVKVTAVHLPGVDTPQFDWARSHLPRRPRPAGGIVRPEVAAAAILRAIRRPEREYWLGRQTLWMLLANMVLPGVFDRMLARSAIEGQMTEARAVPGRPDNLYAPVHAPHRVHGRFGREARAGATLYPAPAARVEALVGALALAAGAGFLAGSALERRHPPRRPVRRAPRLPVRTTRARR